MICNQPDEMAKEYFACEREEFEEQVLSATLYLAGLSNFGTLCLM
jgi:hypothetical protein